MSRFLTPPWREYLLILLVLVAFAITFFVPSSKLLLAICAGLAVIPTMIEAARALYEHRISIDVFNAFAIGVSFVTGQFESTGFIALMLASARILDWRTESRTRHAVEELLKLKPLTATRERNGKNEDVPVEDIQEGDILIVQSGRRIPVDGVVVFGTSYVNEASVTGESALVQKHPGDMVISSTLADSGLLKMRATRVGKDSTIERMAAMMREAGTHKSRTERLADRFAGIFLPIVAALGLVTYLVTRDISMTAALFLIACADDMSVAIPLAMTAALGRAASRGVIVKGGEWFEALSKVQILVLDKTGTLTYGALALQSVEKIPAVSETDFWRYVGIAEKYSEHPVGRFAYKEAVRRVASIPDPEDVKVHKGSGIWAKSGTHDIVLGNAGILDEYALTLPENVRRNGMRPGVSSFFVFVDRAYVGKIVIADIPRAEALQSLKRLTDLGIERTIMLTGDAEDAAAVVANTLGIREYRSSVTPEGKLSELEYLLHSGKSVGMVGDGINDAPALARADVGIAMGEGAMAVATEAADVVILNNNLSRVPETIELGRKTMSVIHTDIAIWFITNIFGFLLVFTGFVGPALAALYNFLTDFLPLLNSTRLFRYKVPERKVVVTEVNPFRI